MVGGIYRVVYIPRVYRVVYTQVVYIPGYPCIPCYSCYSRVVKERGIMRRIEPPNHPFHCWVECAQNPPNHPFHCWVKNTREPHGIINF